MKYSYPPLAVVLIRPHTSECIIPNKSLALSPCLVNGDLVIVLGKQDSHTSYDLKSNESNSPSL